MVVVHSFCVVPLNSFTADLELLNSVSRTSTVCQQFTVHGKCWTTVTSGFTYHSEIVHTLAHLAPVPSACCRQCEVTNIVVLSVLFVVRQLLLYRAQPG